MKKPELFNENYRATYCPESNKLHLYVGRVPRPEYDALRAEGWTSTPKQSEAGQGEFSAPWTPERRDTAESYAGIIEDEDAGPADRAADRAERFSGYRDRRTMEATGHADRYDSGPAFHGAQDYGRAVRQADRHDRIAGRAVDAWSKAEYWQTRTAGVIANALYKCSPSVRMGRIKEIETAMRRIEASGKKAHDEHAAKHSVMLAMVEHAEGKREKMLPFPGWQYCVARIRERDGLADDAAFTPEQMRRVMLSALFCGDYSGKWGERREQIERGEVEAVTVAREWLDAYGWTPPGEYEHDSGDWHTHYALRLAYERQMLGEQGGRAGDLEIEVGGFFGGRRIHKVNKSATTGRVVSVSVAGPKVQGWTYKAANVPGTDYALHQVDVERAAPGSYRAPTEAEKAEFLAEKKAAKAAAPKSEPCPLINPTDDDAERLQAILNERALADHCRRHLKAYSKDYASEFKPSTVCRVTQARYSEVSKGSYSRAETRGLSRNAELANQASNMYCREESERVKRIGPPVCNVRTTGSDGSDYGARRVIVITDKPAKPFPAAVWEAAPAVSTPELCAA